MVKTKSKDKKSTKQDALEYQVNITFDARDKIYVARVPELDNCHSHDQTPEEALVHVKEAIELWLETARKTRIEIPAPMSKLHSMNCGSYVVKLKTA